MRHKHRLEATDDCEVSQHRLHELRWDTLTRPQAWGKWFILLLRITSSENLEHLPVECKDQISQFMEQATVRCSMASLKLWHIAYSRLTYARYSLNARFLRVVLA